MERGADGGKGVEVGPGEGMTASEGKEEIGLSLGSRGTATAACVGESVFTFGSHRRLAVNSCSGGHRERESHATIGRMSWICVARASEEMTGDRSSSTR